MTVLWSFMTLVLVLMMTSWSPKSGLLVAAGPGIEFPPCEQVNSILCGLPRLKDRCPDKCSGGLGQQGGKKQNAKDKKTGKASGENDPAPAPNPITTPNPAPNPAPAPNPNPSPNPAPNPSPHPAPNPAPNPVVNSNVKPPPEIIDDGRTRSDEKEVEGETGVSVPPSANKAKESNKAQQSDSSSKSQSSNSDSTNSQSSNSESSKSQSSTNSDSKKSQSSGSNSQSNSNNNNNNPGGGKTQKQSGNSDSDSASSSSTSSSSNSNSKGGGQKCNKVDPCVDLATANAGFLERCKQRGIKDTCWEKCRYDVNFDEMKKALLSGRCPSAGMRDYLKCGANDQDNRDCCEKTGVLAGRLDFCYPFCNPGGPDWPPPKQAAKYLPCAAQMSQIMKCHWAANEPS